MGVGLLGSWTPKSWTHTAVEARGGRRLGGHLAGVPRLTDMSLEAWEGTGLRLCAVAEQDGQLWSFSAIITELLLPSWPSPGPKEASSHQPPATAKNLSYAQEVSRNRWQLCVIWLHISNQITGCPGALTFEFSGDSRAMKALPEFIYILSPWQEERKGMISNT